MLHLLCDAGTNVEKLNGELARRVEQGKIHSRPSQNKRSWVSWGFGRGSKGPFAPDKILSSQAR